MRASSHAPGRPARDADGADPPDVSALVPSPLVRIDDRTAGAAIRAVGERRPEGGQDADPGEDDETLAHALILTGVKRLCALPALAILVASAGLMAPPASGSHGRCGHVDAGYTSARVTSDGVGCVKSRRIVRRWFRRSDRYCDNRGYCRPAYILGFRCVKGGSGYTVVLRCRDGAKRIRATWGD